MKRYSGFLLPAILFMGTAVRLYGIGSDSLWYDELYTIWSSKLPLAQMLWEVPASGHPPLYYLVLHFWLAISLSDAWIRLISLGAGVATMWLIYLVGRELFNRSTGLWGAAFAAVSPFLAWYSRDATNYGWTIAASTTSLYFLARSIKRGGWQNWTAYVAFTTAALFSHYNAIFLLPAEIPIFLLLRDKSRQQFRGWIISQVSLAIIIIPWLIYNWAATVFMAFKPLSIVEIIDGIATAPVVFIKGYGGMLGSGSSAIFLLDRQKPVLAIAFLIILALFLMRPFRAVFVTKKTMALFFYTLILVAGPVVLQGLRGFPIAGRFYSMAAPTFVILGAVIITKAPPKLRTLSGSVMLLALAGFTAWGLWLTENDDWRGLMTTIQNNEQPGDAVLCFPLHHCMVAEDHYMNEPPLTSGGYLPRNPDRLIVWTPDLAWSGYLADEEIEQFGDDAVQRLDLVHLTDWLNTNFKDNTRVWLVSGTGEIGNYSQAVLMEKALESGWKLKNQWRHSPLLLELYERRG